MLGQNQVSFVIFKLVLHSEIVMTLGHPRVSLNSVIIKICLQSDILLTLGHSRVSLNSNIIRLFLQSDIVMTLGHARISLNSDIMRIILQSDIVFDPTTPTSLLEQCYYWTLSPIGHSVDPRPESSLLGYH
jgi:hypothetical protein